MASKPLSVEKTIANAKSLARQGDLDGARLQYELVLKRFPVNARAKKGLQELQSKAQEQYPVLNTEMVKSLLAQYGQGQVQKVLDQALVYGIAYPQAAIIHNICAVCLRDLRGYKRAIEFCNRAIATAPDFVEPHSNLAVIYRDIGEPETALEHCFAALKLNPDFFDAKRIHALILIDLDRREEALELLQDLQSSAPDLAEIPYYIGATSLELDQMDQALVALDRANELDPDYAPAFSIRAEYQTCTEGDALFDDLNRLLRSPKVHGLEKIAVCFALAKIYEDVGNIEESYRLLALGNEKVWESDPFSIDVERRYFEKVKAALAEIANDRPLPPDPSEKAMIFIVGMPRSGTSLVEQILASHSQVFGAGELEFMRQIMCEIVPRDTFDPATDAKSGTRARGISDLRERYQKALCRFDCAEPVMTDKMPLNFLYVGHILAAFPNAKIVNLNRNRVAVGWSILKRRFIGTAHSYAYRQTDIVDYYNHYEDVMAHWRAQFGARIYDIDYEALTENQEAETRKLLAYCDLEWEDACLDFQSTRRAVKTFSLHQVRKKMYQGSSQAWHKFSPHLGALIAGLNARH